MGTGMTFDEFYDLKMKPHSRADRVFHEAVENARQKAFPMSTEAAAWHLRSRGYDCYRDMLEVLVKHGTIVLAQPDTWTREDVDAAAEYFEEQRLLTPYAMMCSALGCGYADFLRALREASERESAKWGRHVPANDQYFVMHREPPRGITNEQGEPVGYQPAVITFTLCDDIRERLERGEDI